MNEFDLLQVRIGRQVEGELGDKGRSAPVRAKAARIDGCDVAEAEGCPLIAGEDVAIRSRQIGVGVAQVEREDLVGEGQPRVPGVVFRQLNAVGLAWENGVAVERIGSAEPVVAELARNERAEILVRHPGGGQHVFRRDRRVGAVGARIQPWSVPLARPYAPCICSIVVAIQDEMR